MKPIYLYILYFQKIKSKKINNKKNNDVTDKNAQQERSNKNTI